MKQLCSLAICGVLAATAFVSAETDPARVTGDYVEVRTAEVFTGGCILGSEWESLGREAILAMAGVERIGQRHVARRSFRRCRRRRRSQPRIRDAGRSGAIQHSNGVDARRARDTGAAGSARRHGQGACANAHAQCRGAPIGADLIRARRRERTGERRRGHARRDDEVRALSDVRRDALVRSAGLDDEGGARARPLARLVRRRPRRAVGADGSEVFLRRHVQLYAISDRSRSRSRSSRCSAARLTPSARQRTGAPPRRRSPPRFKRLIASGGVRANVAATQLDFWFVKALPVKGGGAGSWTSMEEGTLIGAVRLSSDFRDIRGRLIKPGIYTLRLRTSSHRTATTWGSRHFVTFCS